MYPAQRLSQCFSGHRWRRSSGVFGSAITRALSAGTGPAVLHSEIQLRVGWGAGWAARPQSGAQGEEVVQGRGPCDRGSIPGARRTMLGALFGGDYRDALPMLLGALEPEPSE